MTDKFHQRLECLLIDLEIAAGNIFRDNDTSEERPAVVSHVDAEIAELHRVIDNLREGDELRGKLKAREMALVRDQLDAEIVRLSREKARLALENDRLASSLVEIQEAVADAHGQLTDDGLIDDDYDAIEGVRLLRVQRDNALEAEEMHGRHWDQECEENARLRARLLAEHGDCGSEECDVCALLDLVEVTS